jgi:hypothetical protein
MDPVSMWFRDYRCPINIQCDPQWHNLTEDVDNFCFEVSGEHRVTEVEQSTSRHKMVDLSHFPCLSSSDKAQTKREVLYLSVGEMKD